MITDLTDGVEIGVSGLLSWKLLERLVQGGFEEAVRLVRWYQYASVYVMKFHSACERESCVFVLFR
jgi:hypothetical protein